jgi:hypothetical protein
MENKQSYRNKTKSNDNDAIKPFIGKHDELKEFFVELKSLTGPEHQPVERLRWSNYVEYILSILGFVIDLGNVCGLNF